MTRKLTITYDRRDALFVLSEETEHGGLAEFRSVYHSAVPAVHDFTGSSFHASNILSPLMDGYLTSITLEAP